MLYDYDNGYLPIVVATLFSGRLCNILEVEKTSSGPMAGSRRERVPDPSPWKITSG